LSGFVLVRSHELEEFAEEAVRIRLLAVLFVPLKSPHRIETFDVLLIRVIGAFPEQPIDNSYNVDADGTVNLGPTYGRIAVVGQTIEEAEDVIREQLSKVLTDVDVSVSLLASAGAQAITGQHLVAMDGRVNLGTYGSVYVAGMTLEQARAAIELKLTERLDDPEVFVDVLAYNSKVYYIITQGAGLGDDVTRQPITGNETVIDAVAALGGISQVSSTRMWIARPAPNGVGCEQILPIEWNDIAQGASTATNYQLMPGDRLFIAQDRLTNFNTVVNKILNPFERIFGFISLGTSMANRIVRFGLANTF
jgi:polysaccharide export outer membrane protein